MRDNARVTHKKFPCGDSYVFQKRVLNNVLKPKMVSDPITLGYQSSGAGYIVDTTKEGYQRLEGLN